MPLGELGIQENPAIGKGARDCRSPGLQASRSVVLDHALGQGMQAAICATCAAPVRCPTALVLLSCETVRMTQRGAGIRVARVRAECAHQSPAPPERCSHSPHKACIRPVNPSRDPSAKPATLVQTRRASRGWSRSWRHRCGAQRRSGSSASGMESGRRLCLRAGEVPLDAQRDIQRRHARHDGTRRGRGGA